MNNVYCDGSSPKHLIMITKYLYFCPLTIFELNLSQALSAIVIVAMVDLGWTKEVGDRCLLYMHFIF